QKPAFCYRISVTNCGNVPLTNVMLIDTNFSGDLTALCFGVNPHTLAPNAGCSFTFKTELDAASADSVEVITNTVNASGVFNGVSVNALTNAVVEVVPASVRCEKVYSVDGGALQNNVTLQDT